MAIKFESFRGTGGAVTGGLVYKGSYDAATNSPVLTSAKKGDFYIVSVTGTLAGVTLNVGDHIVFNQDASSPITSAMFDVIDNTDAVASVNGQTGVVSLGASDVNALAIANNLSDLNNATTARTNLGLGTAATKDHGTANGELVILDAVGLPAVDGSQLTGITATDNTKLAIANNLSDLNNATTARTNLGLGTSATLDVGTSANNVVQLDGSSRLPAVDGSQLTNLPSGGGGFTYTAITSASSPVTGAASTHYSANTSGGAITINLPALSGVTAGLEIRVKLKTAGNNLILSPDGTEQVDLGGAGTDYTLTVQNQAVTLVSDGSSNWEVI